MGRQDIFIVMELHSGGELFDRIVGRPRFTEDEVRDFEGKYNVVLNFKYHREEKEERKQQQKYVLKK